MKSIALKTTVSNDAAPDQLSGGERKPTTAARVYDLFDQISQIAYPFDLEEQSRIDEMRDKVVLRIVSQEARHRPCPF